MSHTTEWYIEKLKDLVKMSPFEAQFQNLLVYPILEDVVEGSGFKVIDCHNFAQYNTKTHTRCAYSVLEKAIPDLLIAKNFVYANKGKEQRPALEVAASVEVKEPNAKYTNYLYFELLPSLYKNKKVIFTNLRRWELFNKEKVKDEELKSAIEQYIRILELCGLDKAKDYLPIGKGRKTFNIKVIEEKMEGLRQLDCEMITEYMENPSKEEVSFKDIVKIADEEFIEHIRNYIEQSHVKTIDIISNKDKWDDKNIDTITENIDLQILYHELSNFLFPEQ